MAFTCVTPEFGFSRDEVAVAIAHGAYGGHIGLAFHTESEGPRLLHLRFHRDLKADEFPSVRECWIACIVNLPLPASRQLVGIVRYVAKRLPSINFGVDFIAAKGSFSPLGVYSPPAGSDGLTCATFVTEIFRTAALQLIREESWQPHPDSQKWVEDVQDTLRRAGATETHIRTVAFNFRGLRVRPEEVGAAVDARPAERPLDFNTARAGAAAVRTTLLLCCPPKRSMVLAVAKALLSLLPVRQK